MSVVTVFCSLPSRNTRGIDTLHKLDPPVQASYYCHTTIVFTNTHALGTNGFYHHPPAFNVLLMNSRKQFDKGSHKISDVVKFTALLINFIFREVKREMRGHKR